jgi:hypothetical protein
MNSSFQAKWPLIKIWAVDCGRQKSFYLLYNRTVSYAPPRILLTPEKEKRLPTIYIAVGLEHPYIPHFVFWCSVLCLRTVLGPLRGCG